MPFPRSRIAGGIPAEAILAGEPEGAAGRGSARGEMFMGAQGLSSSRHPMLPLSRPRQDRRMTRELETLVQALVRRVQGDVHLDDFLSWTAGTLEYWLHVMTYGA
ncbi:MAG TPA: hypothetical protein VGW38_22300, partial [Chloroflexota bacterium]|nr:hypothetical protein [Chloroflexota bacterium]